MVIIMYNCIVPNKFKSQTASSIQNNDKVDFEKNVVKSNSILNY